MWCILCPTGWRYCLANHSAAAWPCGCSCRDQGVDCECRCHVLERWVVSIHVDSCWLGWLVFICIDWIAWKHEAGHSTWWDHEHRWACLTLSYTWPISHEVLNQRVCSWPFLRLRVALWKPLATWWSLCWRHFIRHESEISRLVNLEKHLQRQVWSFLINVSLSNPSTPLVPFDQDSKRQRICTLRARRDLSAAKVLSACATCVLCIGMRLGECVCEPSTPHTNRR